MYGTLYNNLLKAKYNSLFMCENSPNILIHLYYKHAYKSDVRNSRIINNYLKKK